MPITRCSDQKRQSLEEFYQEIELHKTVLPDRGKAMLAFIRMINQIFRQIQIFGLTSHDTLLLLKEDNSEADWYVAISCLGYKEYYFEYRMTAEKRPWDYATVRGMASSLDKSKEYLLISMKESGGWQDNEELKNLLSEYKL